jgi:hypothetical protein
MNKEQWEKFDSLIKELGCKTFMAKHAKELLRYK